MASLNALKKKLTRISRIHGRFPGATTRKDVIKDIYASFIGRRSFLSFKLILREFLRAVKTEFTAKYIS